MRQSAVDMEQNQVLLDPTTIQYKIRQKYLCNTCLGILFSGVILSLGFYIGYNVNDCGGSSSLF